MFFTRVFCSVVYAVLVPAKYEALCALVLPKRGKFWFFSLHLVFRNSVSKRGNSSDKGKGNIDVENHNKE